MRTRCDAGRLRQDQRAGKTTLIDIVASKIRPSGGEVRFLGQRITGKQAHQVARLGIARTSQIVQPFVGMTALDVVTIGALFGRAGGTRRLAAARRNAQAALVRLGLGSHRGIVDWIAPIARHKKSSTVCNPLASGRSLKSIKTAFADVLIISFGGMTKWGTGNNERRRV